MPRAGGASRAVATTSPASAPDRPARRNARCVLPEAAVAVVPIMKAPVSPVGNARVTLGSAPGARVPERQIVQLGRMPHSVPVQAAPFTVQVRGWSPEPVREKWKRSATSERAGTGTPDVQTNSAPAVVRVACGAD